MCELTKERKENYKKKSLSVNFLINLMVLVTVENNALVFRSILSIRIQVP